MDDYNSSGRTRTSIIQFVSGAFGWPFSFILSDWAWVALFFDLARGL